MNMWYMGISKTVVPQNEWFIRENPIKIDDLGVPLFLETPIYSMDVWEAQAQNQK